MGSKGNMLGDDSDTPDEIQENVHEERRTEKQKHLAEVERRQKGKSKRVSVWVKEGTLIYEKELKRLQIELLKMQNYV